MATFQIIIKIKRKRGEQKKMANVKTYSKKQDGNTYLTPNFKVREFACKDGTDKILIDLELLSVIQLVRDIMQTPFIINSGYRTERWNRRVRGCKFVISSFSDAHSTLIVMIYDILFGYVIESGFVVLFITVHSHMLIHATQFIMQIMHTTNLNGDLIWFLIKGVYCIKV